MKARFQSDAEGGVPVEPRLVDPEAYDASEQQFAASLERTTPVQSGEPAAELPASQHDVGPAPAAPPNELPPAPEPEAWRQEVATRLNNYRARRRQREPRYPSLQLKFETEPLYPDHDETTSPPRPVVSDQLAIAEVRRPEAPIAPVEFSYPAAVAPPAPEPNPRVIPFPRPAAAPPLPLQELAEPVPSAPRILEAPEAAPPPPALGGILIEPAEEETREKRPGIEVPLQPAPMSRRILAVAMDAVLVLCAFSIFAYIFFEMTAAIPPLKQMAAMSVILLGILWSAYQYLLLIYAGTTPGLLLAKLHLSRFDGSPLPRRARRWRALASILSAASLGLGYAWCALDEDQLCWHDRITGTYMAPKTPEPAEPRSC
jgi:uncharacterized RDD family membrane protein YckC